MERNEIAFVAALAITLALSIVLVVVLRKSLQGILLDLCETQVRARFWAIHNTLLLLLLPATLVILMRPTKGETQSIVFAAADELAWGLGGMIFALFLTALGVATFIKTGPRVIAVSDEQADDLLRLLSRVEEIRAREILKRTGPTSA